MIQHLAFPLQIQAIFVRCTRIQLKHLYLAVRINRIEKWKICKLFTRETFAYTNFNNINFCLVAYKCNEIKNFIMLMGIFETFTTTIFCLPAKYFPFGMLNSEFSFFTQQSYGQRIRGYHYQHRNVECDQRTEYKECSIINHAFIVRWHNIQNVNYTCGKSCRWKILSGNLWKNYR